MAPISSAEIACLAMRGRITINQHWKTWVNSNLAINGWIPLDINLQIIQDAYSLPDSFNTDPADRIITATARIHDLTLITADKKILEYLHVNTMW
jgi:PIN domain nuclease of toxin-antitoxin system